MCTATTAKTKTKSRRSKAGRIERCGNTEKLSCMFKLSCSSVCPPIFLCTVYYFAVVQHPRVATTEAHKGQPLPLCRNSNFHCTLPLHTSIAHFHCTLPLHTSIAHFHCNFQCTLPLNLNIAHARIDLKQLWRGWLLSSFCFLSLSL